MLALLCGGAQATPRDPGIACHVDHARQVDSLRGLPRDVRNALFGAVGRMADRGEFFNATDAVVKPGPFSRFIRADTARGRWAIWFEHGGIAYWKQVVVIATRPSVQVVHNAQGTRRGLCAESARLLFGERH